MARIYLSGPMTGLPEFNYPAFNAAAKQLREMGFSVENPAENTLPTNSAWQTYMRHAVKKMADCDILGLLDGWEKSRGAMVELGLAHTLGIKVVMIESFLNQR